MKKKKNDWKYWVKKAESAVKESDDIPDAGSSFAESVVETLLAISHTIDENERVSENQKRAIKNMEKGIRKWTKPEKKENTDNKDNKQE